MKISYQWLKQYIDLHESPEVIGTRLTGTGLEVEGIEKIDSITGGLQGFVIGEVLTCERFMVKEKQLSLTTVAIGTDTPAQIVCGASNVDAGQKVVVATVGTTLYADGKPLFTIDRKKTYGHFSEGMICAEDELGIGTSHAGIIVLDTDLPNGTPAAQYFKLEADYVFEIGLTPNRADAASHLGVARDLAAVTGNPVKYPSIENFKVQNNQFPIEVTIEATEDCPRFCGVTIDDVEIKSSPEWLQKALRAIGLNPINNVVDVTNYISHGIGQPMHAYDWHQLNGQKIVVKHLPEGTPFVTLDKTTRKLSATDLMICDAEGPLCIGGVFGGLESGVKNETTRIYLECAYFSPASIRKTAMFHGLKTDASFRNERGTDPNAKLDALKLCALLVQEVAGGTIASEVVDLYPNPIADTQISVSYTHIDRLIGKALPKDLIKKILQSLDIEVIDETEKGFVAVVPPYRVDVTREADVIEEILRIYGFDNVELSENLGTDFLANFPKNNPDTLQYRITALLAANGFHEIITNSLTKPAYAEAIKSELPYQDVEILNKLSEDLGVMRQTLLFSGLEVLAHNINRKQKDVRVFEFGKSYHLKEGKYLEKKHLALFLTGQKQVESWQQKSEKAAFHDLAGSLTQVFSRMGFTKVESKQIEQSGTYQYGLTLWLNKREIGSIGLVKEKLCKLAEVKQPVFYAQLDWEYLLKTYKDSIVFAELPRFPEVRRDLSLVIDKTVSFSQIQAIARKYERTLLQNMNVFDVYEGDNLGKDKKSYSVSFILQDFEQTLTDKTIDKTMERLIAGFEKELGAVIRK